MPRLNRGRSWCTSLQVDELLNPTSRIRTLLEDGRVFGVEDGRHAKISIEGFRLFIHSLESDLQILPVHSARLPMSDIVPLAPPAGCSWTCSGRTMDIGVGSLFICSATVH
ncbi:uncharacterized protein LOC123500306 isoform X2 [Portunus trituberculatus]|uniref:uncharacterized protein LOC123500306 isoform X2 n=1 Tax=Portunus trituberculatus TaxID=210409 RepID=UPI001E1CEEE1|nr:uncharacterized protein LOC123500306 isoform X2 [Portunus trituberculatus]